MDVFNFLKLSRKPFLKDDRFIKLIDNEEFPVTIGVSAFLQNIQTINSIKIKLVNYNHFGIFLFPFLDIIIYHFLKRIMVK